MSLPVVLWHHAAEELLTACDSPTKIDVLAVFHDSRDPAEWQSRA
jgi:hypothetical protein